MAKLNPLALGALGIAGAAALAIAGTSLATAGGIEQASTGTVSNGAAAGGTAHGATTFGGYGSYTGRADEDRRDGRRMSVTPVTGDELAKVKDAVTAKDAAVTVAGAMKASDGSYRAMGTKADGSIVMARLSSDLTSVEVMSPMNRGMGGRGGMGGPGGMGRGPGGMGGQAHAPVTGDELTKVKDAVTAKDASITVLRAMKDADGSYCAMGTTKAGDRVMVEVSKDLATVEIRVGAGRGGPGAGMGGPGWRGGDKNVPTPSQDSSATTKDSAYDA